MTDLPARPSLNHLRRQARDLLRDAQAGDTAAIGRIRAVSGALTLASPVDHDLYLAGFGDDNRESLRLLLRHATDVAEIARMALAAPVSTNDTEGVRLLLEAGADPRHYHDDDDRPASVVYEAVRSGCSADLVGLLLDHGAEPDRLGPGGRSPYTLATIQGRADLAALLRRYGAADDTTDLDRFLAACQRADRAAVQQQLTQDPGLPGRLSGHQQAAAMIRAAEVGHVSAIGLMLELGFALDAHGGEDGGTALHAAAYSGSCGVVRLLLDRGADIEARDATWNSTPLDWAVVGSGQRPAGHPSPDWIATVQTLLEAGASAEDITLPPDDPKPPSPEVAVLLRRHGVASEPGSPG
jgi:ankyrin repeat protein